MKYPHLSPDSNVRVDFFRSEGKETESYLIDGYVELAPRTRLSGNLLDAALDVHIVQAFKLVGDNFVKFDDLEFTDEEIEEIFELLVYERQEVENEYRDADFEDDEDSDDYLNYDDYYTSESEPDPSDLTDFYNKLDD